MGQTTDQRYTHVAICLHWAIAGCILFNLVCGHFMEGLKGADKHFWVSLHSSAGLLVLVLSVARVAWRLGHRPPDWPAAMSRVEAGAAHGVHGLLYGLMLALPITGWSISSASTRPGAGAELFFVTHVPKIWLLRNLPLVQKVAVHDQAVLAHQIGGWLMIGLLVAHVLGALKHQFWDRQPQFARMWFGRKRPDV